MALMLGVKILSPAESIGICPSSNQIIIQSNKLQDKLNSQISSHFSPIRLNNDKIYSMEGCFFSEKTCDEKNNEEEISYHSLNYHILFVGEGADSNTRSLLNISFSPQTHLEAPFFSKTMKEISQITSILKFPSDNQGE